MTKRCIFRTGVFGKGSVIVNIEESGKVVIPAKPGIQSLAVH